MGTRSAGSYHVCGATLILTEEMDVQSVWEAAELLSLSIQ